jgi:RHS repeat-associated protein
VQFPSTIAPINYFTYNAPGERIRKDDSTAQKKYTWDGMIPILEKNLSNTTTQRMVKGYTPIAGVGDFVLQDLSGTVVYPYKNQVGTTQRTADTTGAVKSYYEYDGWGQPFAVQEAAGTSQQYRFTGKELDPTFVDFNSVNRRYHFPARFYLPFRGVFAQIEPLIFTSADFSGKWPNLFDHPRSRKSRVLKPYQYVNARPTSAVDPTGAEEWNITGDAFEASFLVFSGVYFHGIAVRQRKECKKYCCDVTWFCVGGSVGFGAFIGALKKWIRADAPATCDEWKGASLNLAVGLQVGGGPAGAIGGSGTFVGGGPTSTVEGGLGGGVGLAGSLFTLEGCYTWSKETPCPK